MSDNYTDRKLEFVSLWDISRHLAGGEPLVGARVRFGISGLDGSSLGPIVDVSVAIRDENKTIEATEFDLLAAAHALLKRVASEPGENLPAALLENRRAGMSPNA